MKKKSKLHYFAPINTPGFEKYTGLKLLVGAAANKVLSVSRALIKSGVDTNIVSSGSIDKKSTKRRYAAKSIKEDGITINYLPSQRNGAIGKITACFNYCKYSFNSISKKDTLVLYNFYPEYLAAALIAKAKGARVFLDIEDAPIAQISLREITTKISFFITRAICQPRYITAANSIDKKLSLKNTCNIYGAIPDNQETPEKNFFDHEIKIIYGGTICNDTGLDLLCDALEIITSKYTSNSPRKFNLIVTGFGQIKKLKALSEKPSKGFQISICENLSRKDYLKILNSAHIGLSLKTDSGIYGDTTFPSKVVEISSHGLLLLTTKASDVPVIFSKDEALFIDENTPEALAKAIIWALENPGKSSDIATSGFKRSMAAFGEKAVGQKIREFIFDDK